MNKQTKNMLLVALIILFLSACGQLKPVSTSAPLATASVVKNDNSSPVKGLVPERFNHYIGLSYPPLPQGLSDSFSMLIQDSEDHSLWLVSDAENQMLWLGKMTHRDSSGNAYWEVKDVLDLSDVESGITLIPDGCSLNGQPDSEIFATGSNGAILQAWRANTTSNVFEVIPTNGLECHSDKGTILE